MGTNPRLTSYQRMLPLQCPAVCMIWCSNSQSNSNSNFAEVDKLNRDSFRINTDKVSYSYTIEIEGNAKVRKIRTYFGMKFLGLLTTFLDVLKLLDSHQWSCPW